MSVTFPASPLPRMLAMTSTDRRSPRPPVGRRRSARARSAGWPTSPTATGGCTVLAWVAALVPRRRAGRRLRRRVQGRLLRARVGLQRSADAARGRFPAQSGDTVDVVVRADGGDRPPAVRTDVRALLAELGRRAARRVGSTTRTRRPAAISADGRTARGARPPRRREPGRHAGRGQPADARRRRRRVRGRGSTSRSAARPSSRPSRARSAPRASGSRPPRSSCCSPSARSWRPGCRSWWPSPAWPSARP